MKEKPVEERLRDLEMELKTVAEAVIALRAGLADLNPREAPVPLPTVQPMIGRSRCRN